MIRKNHALTIGALVVLLVGFVSFSSGWVLARTFGTTPVDSFVAGIGLSTTRQQTPTSLREQFAVFWQVWSLVEGEFYRPEPLDRQSMVYGAIRGMLATLEDDYTFFQEPEDAALSRESMQGSFQGIGAYLRLEEGEIVIDRLFRNAPAELAGLRSGDRILAVDGEPLAELIAGLPEGEATTAAASRIRGPKGTVVTLSIRRPATGETLEFAITRDEVAIVTVNAELLENGVGYIQITEFKATTTELLDQALRELIPQQPSSLVLDLRNNPGGYLQTAREVLGRFYDGVALYEQENGGVVQELGTIAGPADTRLYDIPIVVLINGGSASAAEIVAGALRDGRDHTILVGEKSFGKGSVQNIHQLRDGSSARITVAHWLTPAKSEINQIGITPEHLVAPSEELAYAVPCVADRRPPEGQERCGDAQLAHGLQLLATRTLQPTGVPATP